MKRAKKPKVFDVDYAGFIKADEVRPRHLADNWRLYLDCVPRTDPMRKRLLLDLEAEVVNAFKSGNANFFRSFAKFIEKPKDPCPRRAWLISLHGPDNPTFSHAELVRAAKAEGFYKGMEDENILRNLKLLMTELGFRFTNSPRSK